MKLNFGMMILWKINFDIIWYYVILTDNCQDSSYHLISWTNLWILSFLFFTKINVHLVLDLLWQLFCLPGYKKIYNYLHIKVSWLLSFIISLFWSLEICSVTHFVRLSIHDFLFPFFISFFFLPSVILLLISSSFETVVLYVFVST